MKKNGYWPWTKEELGCGCDHPAFTKTELVKPPTEPGADNRPFFRTVCMNCLTAFKKIPKNEGKVDKALTIYLQEQLARGISAEGEERNAKGRLRREA